MQAVVRENLTYHADDETDPYIRERRKLDLYVPGGADGFATVVFFHGGGLAQGEKYIPGELKNQGFAVVAPNYRLTPRAAAAAAIDDAAAATAWVLARIASFGGDPGRVFVSGASAGGYLAAMVALDKSRLAAHGSDAGRIAGLIAETGQMITHFAIRAERGIPPERVVADELAPIFHIRPDAPPILLVTGDRELDLFGRYEENAFFQRMLKVAGHRDHELYELKGHDHAMVEAAAHPYLVQFVHRLSRT